MFLKKKIASIVVFMSVCLMGHSSVYAISPQYQVIDLGTLDGTPIIATDINNNGVIVGYTSGTNSKAFIWQNGQIEQIDEVDCNRYTPGCKAHGINDLGKVVGSYPNGFGSESHAVVWINGTRHDLQKPLSHKDSYASKINNSDQIIGVHFNMSSQKRGVFWDHLYLYVWEPTELELDGDQIITLNAINNSDQVVGDIWQSDLYRLISLYWEDGVAEIIDEGAALSVAKGINNLGQIVGDSTDDLSIHMTAYVLENGERLSLGTFENGDSSTACSINDISQIVGSSATNGISNDQAFLWENQQMYNLNNHIQPYTGWTLKYATDINNNEWIIGQGTVGYEDRYFLLKPATFPLGDLDGDFDVDAADLANFTNDFAGNNLKADLNKDGFVNDQDISIFANNFGME